MLVHEVGDLVCLLVEEVFAVGDLMVDELLVGDVDEGHEKGEGGEEEGEAPGGGDFDEEVGEEGGEEDLGCVSTMSCEGGEGREHTPIVTSTFSAKTTRWNSMTKKLPSSTKSSITLSSVS